MVLESSIIIINYCTIINAYYNFIVKLMHNIIIIFLIKATSRNAIRREI